MSGGLGGLGCKLVRAMCVCYLLVLQWENRSYYFKTLLKIRITSDFCLTPHRKMIRIIENGNNFRLHCRQIRWPKIGPAKWLTKKVRSKIILKKNRQLCLIHRMNIMFILFFIYSKRPNNKIVQPENTDIYQEFHKIDMIKTFLISERFLLK